MRGTLVDEHPAIARSGWLPILVLLVVTVVVWRDDGLTAAWPWALATLLVTWRFRDPDRSVPPGGRTIVAPVDGWVVGVRRVEASAGVGAGWRVHILVDPLAAYTVRAPIEGRVLDPGAEGGPGRGLWLRDDEGHEVVLVMRAPFGIGAPVASVDIGDRVGHGARCGRPRAAFLATLQLAADAEPQVRFGKRVLAGQSVLALSPRAPAPAAPAGSA